MVSLNAIVRAPNTDQGRRTMGAKVGVRGGVERCGGLVLTLPGNHFLSPTVFEARRRDQLG